MITALKSARTAICQAYSIGSPGGSSMSGVSGGARATNTAGRIACVYEAAKIIAAVENQDDEYTGWLLWAYGPATVASLSSNQRRAIEAVAARTDLAGWCESLRPAGVIRAELVMFAAMDNYRALSVSGARKFRKPAHWDQAVRRISAGQVGINTNQFNREYSALIECVDLACDALDAVALGPVAAALSEVRSYRGETAA